MHCHHPPPPHPSPILSFIPRQSLVANRRRRNPFLLAASFHSLHRTLPLNTAGVAAFGHHPCGEPQSNYFTQVSPHRPHLLTCSLFFHNYRGTIVATMTEPPPIATDTSPLFQTANHHHHKLCLVILILFYPFPGTCHPYPDAGMWSLSSFLPPTLILVSTRGRRRHHLCFTMSVSTLATFII